MALCMSAIIGIGFLIKYTLVSGQERKLKYGDHVDLYLWGMNRHDWGFIHLVLGFAIIGLLALHLFLHWNMITHVYKNLIKKPLSKKAIAICFTIICAALILVPFFIKPEIKNTQNHKQQKTTSIITSIDFDH